MTEPLVLADVTAAMWEAFQEGRQPVLADDLASCWSRARDLGAPPAGAADAIVGRGELAAHAERVAVVHALGDSVLDRAAAQVAEHDFLLLLADPDGVIAGTRGGGGFADIARRMRLIEGACWSEAARGTNAIGTAATANRPTEIHGRAHWGRSYHDLVCYAAPIRGVDGRPLAVLDATSRVERADPAIGRVIGDAVRALEDLLRLQAYATSGGTLRRALTRSLERIADPALLIESPGTIARANTAARSLRGTAIRGGDPCAVLGLEWSALVAEALSPTSGGLPFELRGRAWRAHIEPIVTPAHEVVAAVVVLEPGRMLARSLKHRAAPADPFEPIFAEDPAVTSSIAWARRLAATDLPVMLLAETGSGKELFAQAIHAASPRAEKPWHAINCGALAPALLESELFGYAPGAFTGADRAGRPGLFHAASGGTLFLDEVAEMSGAMQAALLRVVETGTFRRVGDIRLERTDVRIVCATCRDLESLVAAGTFRQDLYYRLKGASVRIPALRERTDLLALAQHLLGGEATLAPDAEAAFARHAWPGNVRELKSVLAVARVASGHAASIELAHLPPEFTATLAQPSGLEDAEREALHRALAETRHNVSATARVLGVARSTVQRMMRRHGVR